MKTAAGKVWLPCLLALALAGCVERTLTITSTPAGALAYVSNVEVGRTPVTIPFTWYGDYDIILRPEGLAGYETLKTHHNVTPPVYDVPPLDLLSAVAPWTYHVKRSAHFNLPKRVEASDEELRRRAEEMRGRTLEELPK